jgi:hypothetical protein
MHKIIKNISGDEIFLPTLPEAIEQEEKPLPTNPEDIEED